MPVIDASKIEYILRTLELPEPLRQSLVQAANADGFVSDDDADTLRALCGARFQTHGFNAQYELTEEGGLLDDLVHDLFTD